MNNVLRAQAFTDHTLFSRVVTEWNLFCAMSQDCGLSFLVGKKRKDTPYRATRRLEMDHYIKIVLEESERLADIPEQK